MSLDGIGQTAQVLTLWWWGQNIIQVICIIIYEVHRATLCHVLGVQQVQHTIYGPVVRDLHGHQQSGHFGCGSTFKVCLEMW